MTLRGLPLLLCTACATTAVMQTPQPLGKGGAEVAVEPGAYGIVPLDGFVFPHLGVRAQFGVSDRLDLGGRLDAGGAHGLALIALTDPSSTGVAVALAPALGIGGLLDSPPLVSLNAQLPLVIGVPLGEHQLLWGPQVQAWGFKDSAAPMELNLLAGGQLGAELVLGDHWSLVPEVSATLPVVGGLGGPNTRVGGQGALAQGVLGVRWHGP
jgi:hypothetical protein